MKAKLAACALCAIFFLAAVANAADRAEERVSAQSKAKASKLKEWIKARAQKFVAKLEGIVNKLKLSLPWDKSGKLKDGKPLDDKATVAAVSDSLTQIHNANDDEFKPDAPELQSSSAEEAHTHAILEAADGMIDPDHPFSQNPDDDINEAVTQGGYEDAESAFSGFAGRGLTRADAGAVVAEDPALEQTPSTAELGSPENDVHSFLEIQETRARLFHRNRHGSLLTSAFTKKAESAFLSVLKGLKHILPQTLSAGVGGNLGPLAGSIDLAFDMNTETMGVVSCVSALFGTDSIGVGVNYHIQAGWYGSNQRKAGKPELDDVWAGFTAGVTGSVGLAAANIPISLGAALGWGANGIKDAWTDFKNSITEAHAKNSNIVQGTESKAAIAWKSLKSGAKKAFDAAKLVAKAAVATLPNGADTIVANVAIGTGISASTLAAGGDVIVGYCSVPKKSDPKTKLWKLLLGLFLVSGPPGAVAGLFSWMAYHTDFIMAALKNLKGKLIKVGKTVGTFAKVAADKIKNFWLARVLPASKDTVANFKGIVAAEKAAIEKGFQKVKTVYFFPTGKVLKDLIAQAKAKLKKFFSTIGNFFKKKTF